MLFQRGFCTRQRKYISKRDTDTRDVRTKDEKRIEHTKYMETHITGHQRKSDM